MRLVLLAAATGLAAGLLGGGRLRHLAGLRVRWPVLLVAAVLTQLGGALLTGRTLTPYAVGLAVSAVLAAAFVALNVGLPGVLLIGLGLALNAAVITANGAMPVSAAAVERAGLELADLRLADGVRHEPATSGTRLSLLADVVAVPVPGAREVVSAGDVLVALGAAWFLAAGVRGAGPRRPVWDDGRHLREGT